MLDLIYTEIDEIQKECLKEVKRHIDIILNKNKINIYDIGEIQSTLEFLFMKIHERQKYDLQEMIRELKKRENS